VLSPPTHVPVATSAYSADADTIPGRIKVDTIGDVDDLALRAAAVASRI
jgi:hypothetical protein